MRVNILNEERTSNLEIEQQLFENSNYIGEGHKYFPQLDNETLSLYTDASYLKRLFNITSPYKNSVNVSQEYVIDIIT
jgi:hypothetical protein